MMDPLNLKNFDFQLPESLIAQKPIDVRDQSKLMVLDRKSGSIKHDMFYNLPNLIPTQSLMVFNNTKVIPSKLIGYQIKNSCPIKVLLLRETTEKNRWEALIKGLGKIKLGIVAQLNLSKSFLHFLINSFINGLLRSWIGYFLRSTIVSNRLFILYIFTNP